MTRVLHIPTGEFVLFMRWDSQTYDTVIENSCYYAHFHLLAESKEYIEEMDSD